MEALSHTDVTDREVMQELGHRLRALREAQRLTRVETAERAGLSRRTVSRAEEGHNPTLLTLVRMLRLYGRLGALEDFLPEPEVSPMAILRDRRGRSGA
ncbi:MAG: XRE family transcriptional regulator [Planctomycetota bacterium]|nr:MAG: XRE family transcriptional regulator [Planctomycetota bacterium]